MYEPEMRLSKWRAWIARDRLGDDFDVPHYFGLLGIYILATPSPSQEEPKHLAPEVIYIGMSGHVTRRTDKTHNAVKRYGTETGDADGLHLFYSEWLSPWSNLQLNTNIGRSRFAYIQYIERKLIWEYAERYERLPKYNKR
jgi:hypothetical protein